MMQTNLWNISREKEKKLIHAAFSNTTPSGIEDINNKPVELGQILQLTFNKGKFNEHKAKFEVVWKDAAYKIISEETGGESFLGSIYSGVEIEIME